MLVTHLKLTAVGSRRVENSEPLGWNADNFVTYLRTFLLFGIRVVLLRLFEQDGLLHF